MANLFARLSFRTIANKTKSLLKSNLQRNLQINKPLCIRRFSAMPEIENPEILNSETENPETKAPETKNPEIKTPNSKNPERSGLGMFSECSESKKKMMPYERIIELVNKDVSFIELKNTLVNSKLKTSSKSLIHILSKLPPEVGQKALVLYNWASQLPECKPNLELFNYFAFWFSKVDDYRSVEYMLEKNSDKVENALELDGKTFECIVKGLVVESGTIKAVRHAIILFNRMEEYGMERTPEAKNFLVKHLCDGGYGAEAEELVKRYADRFYPDEQITSLIVRGYCRSGKLGNYDEARRVMKEMAIAQLKPTYVAYNALLKMVCKLCIDREPFLMAQEVCKLFDEMKVVGITPNAMTFNIALYYLGLVRKTQVAFELFHRMEEFGVSPEQFTYETMIKALYYQCRTEDGHELRQKMYEAGYTGTLGFYSASIVILTAKSRKEHALKLFWAMKEKGVVPHKKIYSILVHRLWMDDDEARAEQLFDEALKDHVFTPDMRQKIMEVKEKNVKIIEEKKKKKRGPTIAEMKKIKIKRDMQKRLSYVRKPKKLSTRRIG